MNSIAIFAGSKIGDRPWQPGKKVRSIAIFGASEIDFRQADLKEAVTQVVAFSLFGANKVIVPQDMPVTLSGFSMFGARADKRSQATKAPPAAAKALHVNAISILGACEVTDQSEDS